MPPYVPTAEEAGDPRLFAENVRVAMLNAMNARSPPLPRVRLADQSMDDFLVWKRLIQSNAFVYERLPETLESFSLGNVRNFLAGTTLGGPNVRAVNLTHALEATRRYIAVYRRGKQYADPRIDKRAFATSMASVLRSEAAAEDVFDLFFEVLRPDDVTEEALEAAARPMEVFDFVRALLYLSQLKLLWPAAGEGSQTRTVHAARRRRIADAVADGDEDDVEARLAALDAKWRERTHAFGGQNGEHPFFLGDAETGMSSKGTQTLPPLVDKVSETTTVVEDPEETDRVVSQS